MRPSALMTVALCLGALAATAIVGCSTSDSPGGSNSGMRGGASGSTSYASPGERVFLTGVGSDGQTIPPLPRA